MAGPWEQYSSPSAAPWEAYKPKPAPLPRGKFGSAIEMAALAADPNLQVTGRSRTASRNAQVGGVPNSAHLTDNARDFAPRRGESLDQARSRLQKEFGSKGYKVIVEGEGAKHSTGPHIHIEATGSSKEFMPWEEYAPNAGADTPPWEHYSKPSGAPQAPKSAPRPGKRPSAPPGGPSLGSTLWQGAANVPGQIARGFDDALSDVQHPVDTAKRWGGEALEAGKQVVKHPVNTAKDALWGTLDYAGGALATGMDALGVPGVNARGKAAEEKFKQGIIKNPIGNAVMALPAARLVGRLGAKGAEAASMAGKTAEERAAIRAERATDAKHANLYRKIQREVVGQHDADRARATAELQSHQRVVGNASVDDQRAIIAAVEGGPKAIATLPEKYRDAAASLRRVAQTFRGKAESVLNKDDGTGPSFIDNYYAHLWKQDAKARAFFSGKQGSGKNLKSRKLPTLEDGLKAGLKPIHENPLDQMSAYVDSMSKYLQAHEIQNRMRRTGIARWSFKNKVPEGHIKLNGIGTEKDAVIINRETDPSKVPGRVLTAPKGAAKLYNNFVDPGVAVRLQRSGHDGLAKAFKGAQKAVNLSTGYTLAFSGFHPTLVAGKAVASDLGSAIQHTFRGHPLKALTSIAHAPIAPVQPVLTALANKLGVSAESRAGKILGAGPSMKKRLLSGEQATTEIDKLYRDAGGRIHGGSEYRASINPNLWTSVGRGTFKRDMADMLKRIGTKGERLSGTADAVSRIMDTFSAPIFDHFVPAMKRQAFEREMAANLKPGMSLEAKQELARRVMDNISGRMGELEHDNFFWSKSGTDIARLVVLSPSWQYGDYKTLKDAAGKNAIGHGVAQAVGLVGSYYLMNGIANYLHTGQRPQGQDWIAYRTGGTTTDHNGTHPERATFPSVMKDAFELVADPVGGAVNKTTPLPRGLLETARNADWRENPIYRPVYADPKDVPPGSSMEENRLLAAGKHVAGAFDPIVTQDNPNGANSGISRFDQMAFGERPAGERFYDPEGYAQLQQYLAKMRMKSAAKAEQKDKQKKAKRQ